MVLAANAVMMKENKRERGEVKLQAGIVQPYFGRDSED